MVHTDHKPLTHFLASDLHEGIYGHWADRLRRLSITIQYVPGHRKKVADGLSRTVFEDAECSESGRVLQIREELTNRGPKWVWKDGAGGFDAFVRSLDQQKKEEVLEHGTVDGLSVFCVSAVPQDRSWKGSICYLCLVGRHPQVPTRRVCYHVTERHTDPKGLRLQDSERYPMEAPKTTFLVFQRAKC